METLFFKIWRNIVLKNYILSQIKGIGEQYLNRKLLLPSIESRIGYNDTCNITSTLQWMVDKNEYEMLIDKIKSNQYIYIDKESIRSLISNCKRIDIFELLFKFKRNELERIDLIQEAVKLDSIFSLEIFIQFYGGVEKVSSTITNNSGEFEYSSLLDTAIGNSSLNVANYLLSINGLNWYTESILIKNALSSDKYLKKHDGSDDYKILKHHKVRNLQLRYDQLLKLEFLTKERLEYFENQKPICSTSIIICKSLIQLYGIEVKPLINKLKSQLKPRFKIYSTDSVLEFIETKLNHSIIELLLKYKNNSKCHLTNISNQVSIIIRTDLILNQFLTIGYKEIIEILVNLRKKDDNINFELKYYQHVNYIKYFMLSNVANNYKPKSLFDNTVGKFKTLVQELNSDMDIGQLLQYCIKDTKMRFINFYRYYVDYYFYQNDFKTILKLGKLWKFALFQLSTLVAINFSIDGFYCMNKLNGESTEFYKDSNEVIDYLDGYLTVTEENTNQYNSFFKSYQEITNFINKIQFSKDIPTIQKVPWSIIFQILIYYYPDEYLEKLILEYNEIKQLFISWLNSNSLFSKLPSIKNIDLCLKYHTGKVYTLPCLFDKCKSGLEKVNYINYLVSVRNKSITYNIKPLIHLIYSIFNGLESLDEAITIYKLLDKNEILNIQNEDPLNENNNLLVKSQWVTNDNSFEFENYTLENCIFDSLIIKYIKSYQLDKIVEILSIINDDGTIINSQFYKMENDGSIYFKINLINYFYSNGYLSLFGGSLSILIIDNFINQLERETNCNIISVNDEMLIIESISIMNKSRKLKNQTLLNLFTISFKKGMNRLFIFLMKLYNNDNGDEKDSNYSNCWLIEKQYNEIKNQIYWEYTNELHNKENDITPLVLLFLNGNIKPLLKTLKDGKNNKLKGEHNLNEFKSNSLSNLEISKIYTIFKISIQHSLKVFSKVYKYFLENTIPSISNKEIFNWLLDLNYENLDIFSFLLNQTKLLTTDGINNESFLLKVFEKGFTQYTNYLITNNKLLSFIKDNINTIYQITLDNGHIQLSKLIISKFNQLQHPFHTIQFTQIILNGYSNVIINLLESNQDKISFINNYYSIILQKNLKFEKIENRILYLVESLEKECKTRNSILNLNCYKDKLLKYYYK